MKTQLENVRNVTISTKVSSAEKIELQQIANDKNITRSELIYDLLKAYKNHYDYIGRTTPKEEKLSAELKKAIREVNKLSIELENAEVRLAIERKEINKLEGEIQRLRKRNINLKDEITTLKSENDDLHQQITPEGEVLAEHNVNQDKNSVTAIVLGITSLLAVPFLLRK